MVDIQDGGRYIHLSISLRLCKGKGKGKLMFQITDISNKSMDTFKCNDCIAGGKIYVATLTSIISHFLTSISRVILQLHTLTLACSGNILI